jgi:hypothetical protein
MSSQKIQLELIASGASQFRATTAQESFWLMALEDPDPTAYHTTQGYILEVLPTGSTTWQTHRRCRFRSICRATRSTHDTPRLDAGSSQIKCIRPKRSASHTSFAKASRWLRASAE